MCHTRSLSPFSSVVYSFFFLDKHYISVATDKSSSTEKSYSGDSRGEHRSEGKCSYALPAVCRMCGAPCATWWPRTTGDLGGLIPTKTSGSVTQMWGMGLCDVEDPMTSVQVLDTVCITLFVLQSFIPSDWVLALAISTHHYTARR